MLAMRPIDEPDVLALLNRRRFEGEVEGYIMMDGPEYIGYALFKVQDDVTTVLDSDVTPEPLLDGIVRACIAAGESRGVQQFSVNTQHPPLVRWWQVFCADYEATAPVDHLFTFC